MTDPIINVKASKIVEEIEETINDKEKLSALRVWLNDRIDQDCKVVFKKSFNKSDESKPD